MFGPLRVCSLSAMKSVVKEGAGGVLLLELAPDMVEIAEGGRK